jgi:hypothetical protein
MIAEPLIGRRVSLTSGQNGPHLKETFR